MRTYQDWRLGVSKPQAAIAVCQLLCELDDEDVIYTMKKIRKLVGKADG